MKKVIIAGSREVPDVKYVAQCVKDIIGEWDFPEEIVTGGARGVDRLAKELAESKGSAHKEVPADWDNFGKAAGHIRNQKMADYVGREGTLIAFPSVKGKGTQDMIQRAIKKQMNVHIFWVD